MPVRARRHLPKSGRLNGKASDRVIAVAEVWPTPFAGALRRPRDTAIDCGRYGELFDFAATTGDLALTRAEDA